MVHDGIRGRTMPLRALLRSLPRDDRLATCVYVALSLASVCAGTVATVLLVALVQPRRALPLPLPHVLGDSFDTMAGAFAVVTGIYALLRWHASRLSARLLGRYGMGLRRRVQARLVDASLPALANATSAEIANVLTYNTEGLVQGLSATQQLFVTGATAAASMAAACWVSPVLVLAMPLLAVLGVLCSRGFGREQSEVSRAYVADMTNLFRHSEDFPRRLRHVRSYGREAAEKASYGDVASRLCRGYARQLELVASGRLMLELGAAVGIALVFALAHRWHGIDGASLMAVCLLFGRLLPYLVTTRQSFQQWRSAAPALELWQRYMELETVTQTAAPSRRPTEARVALRIQRLRVIPPNGGLEVHDLDLVPGELTLVAGDSGIGKSCLMDVLAGMACPEVFAARAGSERLDFEAYRQHVSKGAYVSQSVRPWQRTVRECLLWAAPPASDAALREALADVGLDRRLGSAGLDTSLADASSRLSGGELQRLLLAQVILRQPVLAVLDEATSALDAASELAVLATMKRRLPQTAMVVVSHRAAVAALAEQCLVIGSDRGGAVSPTRATERASA
ncbi:ATP-binding cassette domain-containing protein [Luteibacter yeojuensis]